MKRRSVLAAPLFSLLVITHGPAPSAAGLLYFTDYEEFTAGPDQWVGAGGWEGNSLGVGAHGIDQDAIPGGGLGRTAFVGYAQPLTTLVSVFKPFDYLPAPGDPPIVEVETLVGIQDSIERVNRDSFFVSILDRHGSFLAGIHFANQPASYGIWREDGVLVHDTGVLFFRGELHLLYLRIDLGANRWSAALDGVPLFDNAVFTASGLQPDFGQLAYEWLLTALSPSAYGDNWMLVADTLVRITERPPLTLSSFTLEDGTATLRWPAESGCDYQVEYSPRLDQWLDDLEGSSFPGITSNQILTFSDHPPGPARYYRVLKTYSP